MDLPLSGHSLFDVYPDEAPESSQSSRAGLSASALLTPDSASASAGRRPPSATPISPIMKSCEGCKARSESQFGAIPSNLAPDAHLCNKCKFPNLIQHLMNFLDASMDRSPMDEPSAEDDQVVTIWEIREDIEIALKKYECGERKCISCETLIAKTHQIVVFGYTAETVSAVIAYFYDLGGIIKREDGEGKWTVLTYNTELQARQALAQNGRLLDGVVLGVIPLYLLQNANSSLTKKRKLEYKDADRATKKRATFSGPHLSTPIFQCTGEGCKEVATIGQKCRDCTEKARKRRGGGVCRAVSDILFKW